MDSKEELGPQSYPRIYCVILYYIRLVDTRVLERRQEKTKKSLKIVMFDSQAYHQDRPQGLKNRKINIQELAWLQQNVMGLWPALIP